MFDGGRRDILFSDVTSYKLPVLTRTTPSTLLLATVMRLIESHREIKAEEGQLGKGGRLWLRWGQEKITVTEYDQEYMNKNNIMSQPLHLINI